MMRTISNGVRIACPVMIRPIARNSTCTIFLGDRVQRIAQDALEHDTTFLDGGDDAGEARLGQHHAGRRFGDVGCRRDRNSHLRLAQRRRVVGAVAAHADGMTAVLKCLDELVLVLGQDTGEDRELLGMDSVGDRPGRTDGAIESHRLRHDGRGRRCIARHHHGAHAQSVQFATSAAESGRGGSLSAMSPASFIAVAVPAATASTLKPFASSSFAAAVAVGDGRARPMTTAKAPFTIRCVTSRRVCGGRLRHLLRRIEGGKLD